jgi:hypothetical protein
MAIRSVARCKVYSRGLPNDLRRLIGIFVMHLEGSRRSLYEPRGRFSCGSGGDEPCPRTNLWRYQALLESFSLSFDHDILQDFGNMTFCFNCSGSLDPVPTLPASRPHRPTCPKIDLPALKSTHLPQVTRMTIFRKCEERSRRLCYRSLHAKIFCWVQKNLDHTLASGDAFPSDIARVS